MSSVLLIVSGILLVIFASIILTGGGITAAVGWTAFVALVILAALAFGKKKPTKQNPDLPPPPFPRDDSEISGS